MTWTTTQIPSARLTDASIANTIDDEIRKIDQLIAAICDKAQDTDITDYPLVRTALLAQPSGVATLDGSSEVVQRLSYEGDANGVCPLNASSKVALSYLLTGAGNGLDADTVDGKHAGGASGLATLTGGAVDQDPVNSTATPTASKIVKALGTGKIDVGWIPSDAAGQVPLLDGSAKLKFSQFPTEERNPQYLMAAADATNHPNSKVLTAGTGIVLTPGSGILTIEATSGGSNNRVAGIIYGTSSSPGVASPSSGANPSGDFSIGSTIGFPGDSAYYLVSGVFVFTCSTAGSAAVSVTGSGRYGGDFFNSYNAAGAYCAVPFSFIASGSASIVLNWSHGGGTPRLEYGAVNIVRCG